MTISYISDATLTQMGWKTSSRDQCSLLSRRKIRGALDRHPDATVTSLILMLSCRSCRPNATFAELVRLSRTSIADEMREEHRRRVLIRCYAFRNSSGSLATFAAIRRASSRGRQSLAALSLCTVCYL
jgi:hypothetical protein